MMKGIHECSTSFIWDARLGSFFFLISSSRGQSAIIKCRWWERRHPVLIRRPDGTRKKKKRKEIGNKCFKKSVSFQLSLFFWPNLVEKENLSSFPFWLQLFLEKSFRLQTKQHFFCLFLSQNLKQIKNNRGDSIISKTFFFIPPSLPWKSVTHMTATSSAY